MHEILGVLKDERLEERIWKGLGEQKLKKIGQRK